MTVALSTINQTNQFAIQWREKTLYMGFVSRFIARFSIFIIIFIFTGCNKLKEFGSNKIEGLKQDKLPTYARHIEDERTSNIFARFSEY
jgi:hypothetical protein